MLAGERPSACASAMIVRQSEAVVLRSWPLHEADLIVSLFTRDGGKVKGVAKAAAKSRRRFGGALEPMTHVRAHYALKANRELARLDSFEILRSPLCEPVDYPRAAALAFFAEVLEETLPDHDPHDAVFRLLLSVLEQTRAGSIWMPVTYFALWTTRLMGWLPDLGHCLICGVSLTEEPAFFHAHADGLVCGGHHRPESEMRGSALALDSQRLAVRIFRSPPSALAGEAWPRHRAADLRRFAIQSLERHLERKLTTPMALARL